MTTVQTKSTDDDSPEPKNNSTLLQGLKNDREEDTRKCPHEHCHGNLAVVEDNETEKVLCQSCRCTPNGIYHSPDDYSVPTTDFQTFDPKGSEWDDHLQWRHSGDREEYRNSRKVKMVGGFDDAWSQEHTTREDSLI